MENGFHGTFSQVYLESLHSVEATTLPINDTRSIVKFLRKNIFSRFGTPRALFETALAKYSVRHRIMTTYHPQANRQTKVSNQEVKQILEKIVNPNRKDLAHRLDDALWAYRTTYKTPLSMSPYKLVYEKKLSFAN
ncbi:KRAB-A domain-containing protein 2-like [Gossypium australe]|uniref:KRAB-A domain-containing protein 2-like n=1 Tax=Gossypium australe TaxID=47621 RepID=A0A5B6W7J5_9ROSI|nr:KRAB-A domain-containing protein 2-like [Gossypium australe]